MKIAIIEDDPFTQKLISRVLYSLNGQLTVSAFDNLAAFQRFEDQPWTAVITDLNFGCGSKAAALDLVDRLCRHTKTIVFSGDEQLLSQARDRQSSNLTVLSKRNPFIAVKKVVQDILLQAEPAL